MILHNPTAHLEFLKNFFRDTKTHCTYTWEFCRIFVEFLSFFSLMLYFDKILLSHFVSKCFAFPLPLVGKLEIKEKLGHKYIKLQYVNESMYIHCNKSCGKILFSSSQILGGSWKPHRHFELPPLCSFSAPVTLSQWGKIFFFRMIKIPCINNSTTVFRTLRLQINEYTRSKEFWILTFFMKENLNLGRMCRP